MGLTGVAKHLLLVGERVQRRERRLAGLGRERAAFLASAAGRSDGHERTHRRARGAAERATEAEASTRLDAIRDSIGFRVDEEREETIGAHK